MCSTASMPPVHAEIISEVSKVRRRRKTNRLILPTLLRTLRPHPLEEELGILRLDPRRNAMSQVDDPPTLDPLLRTRQEPVLPPRKLPHLFPNRILTTQQHTRVAVPLQRDPSLRVLPREPRRDGPVESDSLVAALGKGGELCGRGRAFGEDGHGGAGEVERGEFWTDEGGDETEVGEDEGVETVRSEAVGVGVENLEELQSGEGEYVGREREEGRGDAPEHQPEPVRRDTLR